MVKNLVIVESPAKAKTLEKFLGKDFKVEACGGHVRDLPRKTLGVDVAHDFKPTYAVLKERTAIVNALKKSAQKAKIIFLAPDPDREGEAIAWHLKHLLGKNGSVKRIEFHEITRDAVLNALKHPREINVSRVNAQQARRILDRLVGYKISPLLWKKVRKGLSAGRVQSVAVRLICEREEEIKKFKPQEYWEIIAQLITEREGTFPAKLFLKNKIVSSEGEAQKIFDEVKSAHAWQVKEVRKKEQSRYPSPPFITSTLQQEASRRLGYSAKRTMVIAQKLYEGIDLQDEGRVGLITYMRTDSVRLAVEAENEVRKYIIDNFGSRYLPPQPIRYKRKKQAQDAHEAIRPTSVLRAPEKIKASLKPEEFKLYDLIWKKFVACQMSPAVFDQTSVDIAAADYLFRATGSVMKFDGFLKVYEERSRRFGRDPDSRREVGTSGDEEGPEKGLLPELNEGEILNLLDLIKTQHFTEPPARYTEASLVKELEHRGIGRPSTYAPILSTIQERGYVIREGRMLKPAEIGQVTNELLVKHFPKILDIKFTAQMEDNLDKIVAKKKNWVSVLKDFYQPFSGDLAQAEVKMEKVKKEVMTEEPCPLCGKKLMIRSGRYGDFLACSGFPKCKFTRDLEKKEVQLLPEPELCEKCGGKMVLKHGRFGDFLACSGYPKCKNVRSLLKQIGIKCPKDGGEIVERRTRKGRVFYGCSNYPKCDFAAWQRPANV